MNIQVRTSKCGFTMVEIIAVLVIIGIMAAVSAPKFTNMINLTRQKAAMAGINEAKASLSRAYSLAYVENGGAQPSVENVISVLNFIDGTLPEEDVIFGDIRVDLTAGAGNGVLITVDQYNESDWGASKGAAPSDTWFLPVN